MIKYCVKFVVNKPGYFLKKGRIKMIVIAVVGYWILFSVGLILTIVEGIFDEFFKTHLGRLPITLFVAAAVLKYLVT